VMGNRCATIWLSRRGNEHDGATGDHTSNGERGRTEDSGSIGGAKRRASRPAAQADLSNRCLLRSFAVSPILRVNPVSSVLSVHPRGRSSASPYSRRVTALRLRWCRKR
jgi:hypothetical protein